MTAPDDPHTPASDPTAHRAAVWPWLVLALVVIVLDQISKYQIIGSFAYGERLPVIQGFFDLTLLYNPGAAFSFLAGHSGWQRWFFAGIAVVASAVLISLLFSARGQRMFSTALALILGGAIGNLVDRLVLGHVTDFLLFYQGGWAFPAFNLAALAAPPQGPVSACLSRVALPAQSGPPAPVALPDPMNPLPRSTPAPPADRDRAHHEHTRLHAPRHPRHLASRHPG